MTKIDIIQEVYEKLGFSKKDSAQIVESVFDIMKDTLAKGRRSRSPGSATLSSRKRSPPWPQPPDGEGDRNSARRVLTFKSSQVLRKALN